MLDRGENGVLWVDEHSAAGESGEEEVKDLLEEVGIRVSTKKNVNM